MDTSHSPASPLKSTTVNVNGFSYQTYENKQKRPIKVEDKKSLHTYEPP